MQIAQTTAKRFDWIDGWFDEDAVFSLLKDNRPAREDAEFFQEHDGQCDLVLGAHFPAEREMVAAMRHMWEAKK